jgi:plasmid stabilization system protein ParE
MLPVIFGAAARAEMLEAEDWYAARATDLGDRFVAEVEALVQRIAVSPRQFPPAFKDIRRARLRHFPYALFFRITDDAIYVVACFHGNRDPRRWQDRT